MQASTSILMVNFFWSTVIAVNSKIGKEKGLKGRSKMMQYSFPLQKYFVLIIVLIYCQKKDY